METLKFYLVYLPLFVAITIFLIIWLRKKEQAFQTRTLLFFSGLALLLHVTKVWFFPYNTHAFPHILRKSTLENVCAFSAVAYIFILISKSKIAKDYMMIIGMLGGLAAFLYPTEVILGLFDSMPVTYKLGLFSYDAIRFYLVHYLLFIIPFLMYVFKLHKLEMRRAIFLPISILAMMLIVYLNELVLYKIGWLSDINDFFGRDIFYDRNIRNSSFVFGIPENFDMIAGFIKLLVPRFLRPNDIYVPILWFILPAFVYGIIIYIPFTWISNKEDIQLFLNKMKKINK